MASRLFQRFYLFATSGGAPEGNGGSDGKKRQTILVEIRMVRFFLNQWCFFGALSSTKTPPGKCPIF